MKIMSNFVDRELGALDKFPFFPSTFLPKVADIAATVQKVSITCMLIFIRWEDSFAVIEIKILNNFSNSMAKFLNWGKPTLW